MLACDPRSSTIFSQQIFQNTPKIDIKRPCRGVSKIQRQDFNQYSYLDISRLHPCPSHPSAEMTCRFRFQVLERNTGFDVSIVFSDLFLVSNPIESMYGIFNLHHKNQPNVGKYTIHGSHWNVLPMILGRV